MTSTGSLTRRPLLGALAAVPVAAALPSEAWASPVATRSRDSMGGFRTAKAAPLPLGLDSTKEIR